MQNQTVLILDFGGQYKQLIARRVRDMNVYAIIKPGSMPVSEIRALAPIGIIFTGGPRSIYEEGAPSCDPALFQLGIPVLGICYGMHLMADALGGRVAPAERREYGLKEAIVTGVDHPLMRGMPASGQMLMSHGDQVTALPKGFVGLAHTDTCPFAAMASDDRRLYAVQFHPEVETSEGGRQLLHNFVFAICGATGDYTMDDVLRRLLGDIRAQVGDQRVLLALSGGVDSSVVAALLSKAIPGQLVCIFVDHGLMRKDEGDQIEAAFSGRDLDFRRVNAEARFLAALAGVTDPEEKRKRIGDGFIRVFEEVAEELRGIPFLAQGTIYPDIIESGEGDAATIKSHHNVGGLPAVMSFEGIVEPLRDLFKDEVRRIGRMLNLPASLTERQPFPGPGLGIRVIGEVTKPRLDCLREADAIWREVLEKSGVKADQYFAVLTNVQSVGVMGDGRTYDYTVALRAVRTSDFMTAEAVEVPFAVLAQAAARITGEVAGINRVVYDITGKPPGTIEWE